MTENIPATAGLFGLMACGVFALSLLKQIVSTRWAHWRRDYRRCWQVTAKPRGAIGRQGGISP